MRLTLFLVDIINVVSVTGPVTVNQWIESDDEEIQDALYWRQAYDCRNMQLSVCLSISHLFSESTDDPLVR